MGPIPGKVTNQAAIKMLKEIRARLVDDDRGPVMIVTTVPLDSLIETLSKLPGKKTIYFKELIGLLYKRAIRNKEAP